jgi:hypothetical protein
MTMDVHEMYESISYIKLLAADREDEIVERLIEIVESLIDRAHD